MFSTAMAPIYLIWLIPAAGLLVILVYGSFTLGRRKARREERRRLEAQVRHSQELETLGKLTAGIAHDFNNTLAIILGYAEMGRDEVPKQGSARENIEEALKAGYRARDLAKQLLVISRGSSPERGPIAMAQLIEESLQMLRASFPRTVKIQREIDPDAGFISGHLSQIYQVIINLCLNARDAMQEGTVTVGLSSVVLDSEFVGRHGVVAGNYVKLTVSDTGEGITPEVRSRIFEPFFTTKIAGEGTGMGLPVVRSIIENHDGVIEVSSRPGEGATFEVYLPRTEGQRESVESKDPDIAAEDTPIRSRARVLFVDDDEPIATMGQRMLERFGYEVTAKLDSREAFETFRSQPDRFDVVVTDYYMPHLVGTDLARKLKTIRPDIPLILITGFSHMVSPEQAREAGFREFLLKPMAARELGRAVRQALTH